MSERPPQVVGYRERPFLTTGAATHYYCGADAPRVDWPTVMQPIWRGEAPEGASCRTCGIDLDEL